MAFAGGKREKERKKERREQGKGGEVNPADPLTPSLCWLGLGPGGWHLKGRWGAIAAHCW